MEVIDVVWTIWDEMKRIQGEMDRMFNRFFTATEPFGFASTPMLPSSSITDIVRSNYRQPLSDIWETDKEIIVTVELPGVDKKDIQVNLTSDGLEIRVEKKDEYKEEDKKRGMYRLERSYSGFYRHFTLPKNIVDTEKIKATYKNGVLELRIPKRKVEEKKVKRIEVK